MADPEAHYIIPKACEWCGSENIAVKVIYDKGICRYVCLDCGESRSIAKQRDIRINHNRCKGARQKNWSYQVKKLRPCCTICGATENLEAHHIIPVANAPMYAFEITNGITLCSSCHRLVHKRDGGPDNAKTGD